MHMLDPKNIDLLTSLGGTDSMLRDLGAHTQHVLSTKDPSVEQEDHGASLGASHINFYPPSDL